MGLPTTFSLSLLLISMLLNRSLSVLQNSFKTTPLTPLVMLEHGREVQSQKQAKHHVAQHAEIRPTRSTRPIQPPRCKLEMEGMVVAVAGDFTY
jgi:hypothetical protein